MISFFLNRYTVRLFFFFWAVQGFAAFNLTWGTPAVGLDSNPPLGDTDGNAVIAIDPMGNAIATWSRTTGSGASENIWAAVYNHSLRVWGGAVKVSGRGSAANSQVALDEEGNAIFVWEEGFPTQIMVRTLSAAGVWTPDLSMPPEPLQKSQSTQINPQISVDSQGNAVAIWIEFSKRKSHIYSAKKPVGTPWISLGKISSGLQNCTLIPSKALVLNPSGKGAAVWEESNNGLSEIHGARYTTGSWSLPFTIAADSNQSAESPSVGIDALGNALIVWSQNDIIFSKILNKDALFSEPLAASNPEYIAKRPHVGVDAAGNAVVVFERYNALHKFISGAELNKETLAWTAPIDISGPSPSDAVAAGYPVFSMNSIGDGVVIWKEWTGSNMVIQGAGYSLGTWSFIKTLSNNSVNSGASTPAYDISVALNHAGNILAIWPEDPSGANCLQIKATAGVGLANAGPLPPIADPTTLFSGIVSGKQVLHRFPAHSDLINILSWNSPGGIEYFNIYRGNLSSLIASTQEPYFEDHQRSYRKKETYLITSVDHNKQESGPITIVVHPR